MFREIVTLNWAQGGVGSNSKWFARGPNAQVKKSHPQVFGEIFFKNLYLIAVGLPRSLE